MTEATITLGNGLEGGFPARTELNFDPRTLSASQRNTLKHLSPLIRSASDRISTNFQESFLDYQTYDRGITDGRIDGYLDRTQLYRPQFAIYEGRGAEDFLTKTQQDAKKIKPSSLLLVFNLPKPIAVYWDKVKLDQLNEEYLEGGCVSQSIKPIEWGRFRWDMLRDMRDMIADDTSGVRFEKINNPRTHDARNFYYIWEVKPKV
ncbi:MAG TPA: hypothetical protein VG965_01820 [Patescibacteria group bacterium]|nr:hypothetical protein [Patescibacteria group bacterium]